MVNNAHTCFKNTCNFCTLDCIPNSQQAVVTCNWDLLQRINLQKVLKYVRVGLQKCQQELRTIIRNNQLAYK